MVAFNLNQSYLLQAVDISTPETSSTSSSKKSSTKDDSNGATTEEFRPPDATVESEEQCMSCNRSCSVAILFALESANPWEVDWHGLLSSPSEKAISV